MRRGKTQADLSPENFNAASLALFERLHALMQRDTGSTVVSRSGSQAGVTSIFKPGSSFTMKRSVFAIAASAFIAVVPVNASEDRYEHHKGLPAETLQQAVANFSEYNARLEAILAGSLDDSAMHDVHELTYTLENALAKINAELAQLTDTLEELHQASERMDGATVSKHGRIYLDVAREVNKSF